MGGEAPVQQPAARWSGVTAGALIMIPASGVRSQGFQP